MLKPLMQRSALPACEIARKETLRQQGNSSTPAIGWSHTMRIWMARSRQRKALGELAELNDYLLEDIGLTQEAARREAGKPFWRQ